MDSIMPNCESVRKRGLLKGQGVSLGEVFALCGVGDEKPVKACIASACRGGLIGLIGLIGGVEGEPGFWNTISTLLPIAESERTCE
jgi:hypothetical protein